MKTRLQQETIRLLDELNECGDGPGDWIDVEYRFDPGMDNLIASGQFDGFDRGRDGQWSMRIVGEMCSVWDIDMDCVVSVRRAKARNRTE